ncbi:MFS transporter [Phytomonospora endophytica]|uniref:MFS family permease n=1 Tax=Phytomonospora endophytica TaxID=714109 RepID=A0A841FZQ9_9ACTN|nr:MFS transporter [Phytomonospora endophytica]MBB6038877.1 MFS family permease [Phytomonospora endophytica]GIG68328.1 MFS transporter [Phytomonospora endophytica]
MRKLSGFGALWASQATSNIADGILAAAAPLLMAAMNRDPLAVAGMTIVQFLPWLLFTLPAGALTDRIDRRRILVAGNLLRAAGFALLATAVALGWENVWLLYAAVFVAGTAETLVDNAALTVPPRIVPRASLERANGRLFATQSVVNTFVGPPVGSFLAAVAATLALFSGAGLFAVAGLAALLLPRLLPTAREEADPRRTPASVLGDIKTGWNHFWNHRLLRRVALISAAINFFGTATGAILVLLATGPLGVPAALYGLFIAVPAAGAIIGSLIAEKVIPRIGGGPVTWAAALAPAAGYAVLGLSTGIVPALAAMFIAAVATACNQIVVSTLRQATVPDALLGRVTAAYRLVVLGVVPFGGLTGGLLGATVGVRQTFVFAAAGLAVAAAVLAPGVTTDALRRAEPSSPAGERPVLADAENG